MQEDDPASLSLPEAASIESLTRLAANYILKLHLARLFSESRRNLSRWLKLFLELENECYVINGN